jgi:beta-ureidopropionase
MTVKIALVQMQTSTSKDANIEKATAHISAAAAQGANIVCLQEIFNTIYFCYEHNAAHFALAEPLDGPTIETMRAVAAQHGIVLVAPIYEQAMPGELYNTAVVLGTRGEIIGKYRKSSIPMVIKPSMVGSEKFYFTPGNTGFQVWDTPFGIKLGLLICYDRHFPEAARLLALRGAQLVLIPNATAGTSDYAWETEMRAHAIANIYYVGAVNRVGVDIGGEPNTHFYGRSFFCDYRGDVQARAGDQHDEIVYGEITEDGLRDMEALRGEWGFFRDRRPDLYRDLASSL